MSELIVTRVTLYYQTERQAGRGAAGWAYNVIDSDGNHTSGGFDLDDPTEGGATLSQVREAFAAEWPEVAAQVITWDQLPEGGWRGRPQAQRHRSVR